MKISEIEAIDNLKYERELKREGYKVIVGTDEAGRGPLVGPVVAGACYIPDGFKLEGLTDSKKLTEKKREEMYKYITQNTIYGVGIVSPEEIDEINIYEASRKAMLIAINRVRSKIGVDYVLSDAMPIELDIPVKPIIKGDLLSMSIAAASVIAKVTRDHMMIELDKKYPEYGFKKHKGYPTRKHYDALNKYGLIDGYRKTYGPVKRILEGEKL